MLNHRKDSCGAGVVGVRCVQQSWCPSTRKQDMNDVHSEPTTNKAEAENGQKNAPIKYSQTLGKCLASQIAYSCESSCKWSTQSSCSCIKYLMFAQCICICKAAKEIHRARMRAIGKVRALVGVYYGKPAVEQGRSSWWSGGERYWAPRGPNPASISSFSLCADRRHTLARGLEKSHFYSFQWNLITSWNCSFFSDRKLACCYPIKRESIYPTSAEIQHWFTGSVTN